MDEVFVCLSDEATKTKQNLDNAFQEKETEKVKLVSIYKALTEKELKAIFSEIESDKKIPSVPLHQDYHVLYWKWKDAFEINKNAQTKLAKYESNMNPTIPDVSTELKEMKQQNDELKNEVKELKNEVKELKEMTEEVLQGKLF